MKALRTFQNCFVHIAQGEAMTAGGGDFSSADMFGFMWLSVSCLHC